MNKTAIKNYLQYGFIYDKINLLKAVNRTDRNKSANLLTC